VEPIKFTLYAYDAFNAFGTPGQRAPVTPTDLLVLQALGFQLSRTRRRRIPHNQPRSDKCANDRAEHCWFASWEFARPRPYCRIVKSVHRCRFPGATRRINHDERSIAGHDQ
jgi:hypothetical protein